MSVRVQLLRIAAWATLAVTFITAIALWESASELTLLDELNYPDSTQGDDVDGRRLAVGFAVLVVGSALSLAFHVVADIARSLASLQPSERR